ncbi:MAG: hypothetical protein B6I38_09690 [Anaerolineaceae bacterium 4572_5.1]|nr:MAG: hypothetical protein B5M51_08640 [Anaerolinea sp. 4484_236]OQY27860.1 MAG: hypothetical protein B6I38_09690 [Anaerolineaceae bacterium 4572_5.1]RLD06835.1 MAG: hypothetical protein DRI56_07465 [Chloroflexota bacterium]
MRSRTVPQPAWNLEYAMWMFTRLSGLAIPLFGLIGITAALIMGARTQMDLGTLVRWTFFPNVSHVMNSNIPDYMSWGGSFWQIMELMIAFFGLTHGFNGLRVVLEDYTNPGFWQVFWRGIIFLLWLFSFLAAIYVVISS